MDMLTFLMSKQRGDKTPKFVIGQDHALADPDRPAYAPDNAIARSLYEHYDRNLRDSELISNPLWHAMKAQASAIRMEQALEPPKYSSAQDIPDAGGDQTRLLIDAAFKRDQMNRVVDETVFPDKARDAKATLHRAAVEEGYSGQRPDGVHSSNIEGLGQIWDSAPGRDYRASVRAIGEASREWTNKENVDIHRSNEDLNRDEKEAIVDSRKVYDAVIRSMPEAIDVPKGRWTDNYAMVATTNIESEVLKGVMGIALKAVDERRDPTTKEMNASLDALKAELAEPRKEKRYQMERVSRPVPPPHQATPAHIIEAMVAKAPESERAAMQAEFDRVERSKAISRGELKGTATPITLEQITEVERAKVARQMPAAKKEQEEAREALRVAEERRAAAMAPLNAAHADRETAIAAMAKAREGDKTIGAAETERLRAKAAEALRKANEALDAKRKETAPAIGAAKKMVDEAQEVFQTRSAEVTRLTAAMGPTVTTGRGGAKFTTFEQPRYVDVTMRPAITTDPNATRFPLVGLEGQRFYADQKAIGAVMAEKMANAAARTETGEDGRERRGGKPTFISFAPDGSGFQRALIAAAEKANVPVMRATMDVSVKTHAMLSDQTRQHVDGEYAAESIRFRHVMRTATFDEAVETRSWDQGERKQKVTQLPRETDPLSFDGRRAAAGALILMRVDARQEQGRSATQAEAMEFQATINNAALLPNDLVAFGNTNRKDQALPRIINRRMLSGYETPEMHDDKTKGLVPKSVVENFARNSGETLHEYRSRDAQKAHTWRMDTPDAQLVVGRLVNDPRKTALLIENFATIGDIVQAGHDIRKSPQGFRETQQRLGIDKETGLAAVALQRQTRNVQDYAHAVNVAMEYAGVAEKRQNTLLTDPRDPLVALNRHVTGFSTPAARNAPEGSRIAIVGDEKPLNELHARQIDIVVKRLADQYGRDENGVARMRINTTLTPGVGEAVMEAGLRHKVPVEAIGYKDDYRFKNGTPDMRLFGLADDLEKAGLGGTWTLHKSGNKGGAVQYMPSTENSKNPVKVPTNVEDSTSSRERAMQAAMASSDAIIASRFEKTDLAVMAVAAAGQTKGLFTIPPAGPNQEPWSGTRELNKQDRNITMLLDLHNGSGRAWQTDVIPGGNFRARPNEGTVHAAINTNAGATEIRSSVDLENVVAAARGKADHSMGRPDAALENRRSMASGKLSHERYDVMEQIDYERFNQKDYVEGLKLRPVEMKMARELYGHMLVQMEQDGITTGAGYQEGRGEMKDLTSYAAGRSKNGSDRRNGGFEVVDRANILRKDGGMDI